MMKALPRNWYAYAYEHFFVIDTLDHANEVAFVNDYRGLKKLRISNLNGLPTRGSYYFCYVASCEIEAGDEALVDFGESH